MINERFMNMIKNKVYKTVPIRPKETTSTFTQCNGRQKRTWSNSAQLEMNVNHANVRTSNCRIKCRLDDLCIFIVALNMCTTIKCQIQLRQMFVPQNSDLATSTFMKTTGGQTDIPTYRHAIRYTNRQAN